MIRIKRLPFLLGTAVIAAYATACASASGGGPAIGGPGGEAGASPESERGTLAAPKGAKPGGRTWRVAVEPGAYHYVIIRGGSVAQFPDSGRWLPIPSVKERVALRLASDASVEVTSPVISAEKGCTPAQALAVRAQQLIPKLPATLVEGSTWTDSTVTSACRGTVPATVIAVSKYVVAGDTVIDGVTAVIIRRSGTIDATGEGHQGEHRILLRAAGVDSTTMTVSVSPTKLLTSSSQQNTTVDVTTSGRTTRFSQRSTEVARLTD